jgi:hypothetical protein
MNVRQYVRDDIGLAVGLELGENIDGDRQAQIVVKAKKRYIKNGRNADKGGKREERCRSWIQST